VVFSPYDNKDNDELEALKLEKVAMVAGDYKNSVQQLIKVMSDNDKAISLSKNALKKMTVNGVTNLSKEIYSLVN